MKACDDSMLIPLAWAGASNPASTSGWSFGVGGHRQRIFAPFLPIVAVSVSRSVPAIVQAPFGIDGRPPGHIRRDRGYPPRGRCVSPPRIWRQGFSPSLEFLHFKPRVSLPFAVIGVSMRASGAVILRPQFRPKDPFHCR